MITLLHRKLFARVFRNEAGENGDPAGGTDTGSEPTVDWADLNDGVEPGADDEVEEGAVPTTPAAAAPAAAPAAAAPASPTPGTDQVVQPAAAPEGTQTPVPVEEPKTLTPEEQAAQDKKLQEDFAKWEASTMQELEKAYAFDEDTARRLQTEPELVLPQVAAKLHMDVTKRVLETVQRLLPQVVPTVVQNEGREKAAADAFYTAHPDLKQYHKQVLQAGAMYRQLNPKATPEQAIKQIGKIVRDSLGLPEVQAAAAAGAPAAGKPAPHKPAGAGGTGRAAPQAAKADASVWSDLASDDD